MLTTGLVHGEKTGPSAGACPVKGCRAHSVEAPEPSDMDCVCTPATWNIKLAVLLFQGHARKHQHSMCAGHYPHMTCHCIILCINHNCNRA